MSPKKIQPALIILLEDTNRDEIRDKLTDDLSPNDKNRLYKAFIEDTIYTCLNLPNVILEVDCPSDAAREIFEAAVDTLRHRIATHLRKTLEGDDFKMVSSQGKNAGERLKFAFEQAFEKGYSPVVLIGCVTPTLSKKALQCAFRQLKASDVVFGPTLEGSYYLIGLREMKGDVFDKIDWSNEEAVYSQMVNVVSQSTLKWHELDLWYALRQPEDFEFLIRDINFFRQVGDERSAACTEEILGEILNRM